MLILPVYKADHARCWSEIDFEKTEKALLTVPILKKVPIEEYLKIQIRPENPVVFLLFLKNGLKAVFKPRRSDRNKNRRTDRNIYASVMMYHFSQFMKWKLVPPTVIRTIDGEKGSVQLFIEGSRFNRFTEKLTPIQKSDIFIYYFVSGESDTSSRNILLGKTCGKPALIDNDQIFSSYVYAEYGDHPFLRVKIENVNSSMSSYEDYKKFPVERVQSVSMNKLTFSQFKNFFSGVHSGTLHWLYKWNFEDNYINNLYFVKWKNAYWLKLNSPHHSFIYKDFVPVVFSKKTIHRLKLLNSATVRAFSLAFPISQEIILGILYRRDLILKEAGKTGVW